MRFRFGGGEEQLFVVDILPLLDVHEEENSTNSSGTSSSGSGKLVPSSRPRARTRAKIKRLRCEIQTLGLELAGLQPSGLVNSEKRSRWKDIAKKEEVQRQHSEHDNRVLKRMIAAQHVLVKSILSGRVHFTSEVSAEQCEVAAPLKDFA